MGLHLGSDATVETFTGQDVAEASAALACTALPRLRRWLAYGDTRRLGVGAWLHDRPAPDGAAGAVGAAGASDGYVAAAARGDGTATPKFAVVLLQDASFREDKSRCTHTRLLLPLWQDSMGVGLYCLANGKRPLFARVCYQGDNSNNIVVEDVTWRYGRVLCKWACPTLQGG